MIQQTRWRSILKIVYLSIFEISSTMMKRQKSPQFSLSFRLIEMYSEIFGIRINLIYVTILVAFYDLVHIAYELKQRHDLFWIYEDYDGGCLNNLFQKHCKFIFSEVFIYVVDFIFTSFLIYGSFSVRKFVKF